MSGNRSRLPFAITTIMIIILGIAVAAYSMSASAEPIPQDQAGGSSASLLDLGIINLGDIVQGTVLVKDSPGDLTPQELVYTYMRTQPSTSALEDLKLEPGVTQNTIDAIDQYLLLSDNNLLSILDLLTGTLSEPPAFIYYTWEGNSGYIMDTTLDGYDPIGVATALLGLGTYTSEGSSLISEPLIEIPLLSGLLSGVGQVLNSTGAGTLVGPLLADLVAPSTSDDAPAGWQNQGLTVNLFCTDILSGCASTFYQVDGGALQSGTSIPLNSEGEHTITYYSVDVDNNSETPRSATVRVDLTPPIVTGIEPAQNVGNTFATLRADYSDATSGIDLGAVTVTLDGVTQSCTVLAGEVSCPVTDLLAGNHVIAVNTQDNAGNTTQETSTFIVDRNYYFNWYDSTQSMYSWLLMANPAAASDNLEFGLTIAGGNMGLDSLGLGTGVVPPGGKLTPIYRDVMGGPVKVKSTTGGSGIVSQRTLIGNSFEEIAARGQEMLSDHYYWTWYDQLSTGFANWIMIANPSSQDTVHVTVSFTNRNDGSPVAAESDIAPGGSWTPSFPGKMGGPVEVKAKLAGGSWPADARDVIASQRVLTNFGTAFNELPGIPADDLTSDYVWTWYDMSGNAQNWVMLANPNAGLVDYVIKIAGVVKATGTLQPAGDAQGRDQVTPVFPGVMGGPVEVSSTGGNIITTQRSLWGPSFGEIPGYSRSTLASDYHMTWYDMSSPGVVNWLLVANPNQTPVNYSIIIDGDVMSAGTLQPVGDPQGRDRATPTFPGVMAGPVQVISTGGDVLVSQRVLWNGYFNEVVGTVLE